jgi:phthiocerol/phenolphthiocerol synthesis type-I polyketide synthase E
MPGEEMNKEPERVAVIGMTGRFPGARNIEEFWRILSEGVEAVKPFTVEELRESGVDEKTLKDPNFVNAGAVMPNADAFDASFFGINVREAEIMDPQHRVFLETAWEALEDAGYDTERFQGSIGIFGGVGPNTYFQNNLVTRPELLRTLGRYAVLIGSEREYAVTRVSFKLNLTGPSFSVNTACSTSAVAIHLACQSLLNGECDMALAGGARIVFPFGYMYEEGGILSPDGHCRAFDAEARGTILGNGVGIVVLKRLSEAIQDGDCIRAVIKGSAINNDGSEKVGFTAPSIRGQASVISEALAIADVNPESIGYVEAHGTGTSLGDPIEIAALTQAFRNWTKMKGYCPIGSVKTNIGHLDAGAGVAGVIKTVLALENKLIPPSLNFVHPNPQINFKNSPFYVNSELQKWNTDGIPRRAGVSSFGLGGTNAHIILEESPKIELSSPSRSHQLLLLSTKTDTALTQATNDLAQYLRQHPSINLPDVAYTLQTGRRAFNCRRMVVCQDIQEVITNLLSIDPKRVITGELEPTERSIVFMFPGQGSQYVNMGLELYRAESAFREEMDRCCDVLKLHLDLDLRDILYPEKADLEESAKKLEQTSLTQSALFAFEHSLTKLWLSWGVRPIAFVGHSIGEYVAACQAGVFSLEDALSLVATRGQLMQHLPGGGMLAIALSEKEIQPFLNQGISLSNINSPSSCVVSGEPEAIEELKNQLTIKNIDFRSLRTSHAFHSTMMDPILESFTEHVKQAKLSPPQIPFVSNLTGTWIRNEEAVSPYYWVTHLRQTVRFSDCVQELLKNPDQVFLEVGPGQTLSTFVRQHPGKTNGRVVLNTIRHPNEERSDIDFILNTLGRLWLYGINIDWSGFYANEKRHRVSLPTYPFERKRFWINPGKEINSDGSSELAITDEPKPDLTINSTQLDQKKCRMKVDVPRDKVQQSLFDIWKSLLGVNRISIHDNFFDLGGSSLLATRLLTQIGNVFGKKLPLAIIFEAPTIEQLACVLEQKALSVAHSSLVKVQAGQSRPPFYCLPGNLGNVFIDLGHLSRHLGMDQTFYGLQDGIGHPSKVEKLAAHYVEEIRSTQPDGPYFLGGICSGGVIAFEIAQQLIRQGQHIAFLALVEPAALPLPGARSYFDFIAEVWSRFTHLGPYLQSSTKLSLKEIKMLVRLRMKLIANLWALKQYIPQLFPGRFHLFLTEESLTRSPRLGWRKFAADGVKVHKIPGTHRSIVGDNTMIDKDHIQNLGKILRENLDYAIIDTQEFLSSVNRLEIK